MECTAKRIVSWHVCLAPVVRAKRICSAALGVERMHSLGMHIPAHLLEFDDALVTTPVLCGFP